MSCNPRGAGPLPASEFQSRGAAAACQLAMRIGLCLQALGPALPQVHALANEVEAARAKADEDNEEMARAAKREREGDHARARAEIEEARRGQEEAVRRAARSVEAARLEAAEEKREITRRFEAELAVSDGHGRGTRQRPPTVCCASAPRLSA